MGQPQILAGQRQRDRDLSSGRVGQRIREDETWAVGLDNYEHLQAAVRDCMEAGVLPRGDVEAATLAAWAEVHGIASLVTSGRLPRRN